MDQKSLEHKVLLDSYIVKKIIAYTDAKGSGGVTIGTSSSDNSKVVWDTSTALGQKAVENAEAVNSASGNQARSLEKDLVFTSEQSRDFNKIANSNNTAVGSGTDTGNTSDGNIKKKVQLLVVVNLLQEVEETLEVLVILF